MNQGVIFTCFRHIDEYPAIFKHALKGCRNLPTAFSNVYIPGALTAPFPLPDELPGPPGLADGVFWGTDTL